MGFPFKNARECSGAATACDPASCGSSLAGDDRWLMISSGIYTNQYIGEYQNP
jgi:hypothetical protein